MNEIYYYILSYSLIIILFFVLFNWLSTGFLLFFLRVKASRGKKILVINKGAIENYASIGWVEGNQFCYKDRETKRKEKNKVCKRLVITENNKPFFRLFGVTCVMVDESTNTFITPSGSSIGGFDAITQENLIMWALQKPKDEDKTKLLIIINLILTILVVLGLVIIFVKIQQHDASIKLLLNGFKTIEGVNII